MSISAVERVIAEATGIDLRVTGERLVLPRSLQETGETPEAKAA
jgi:hypothetical protein